MRVCTCPNCGQQIRDNPLWRGSRYDFNADYMRFEDAINQPELKEIALALEPKGNFEPFIGLLNTYYKRGKGGKWFYRVPNEDFKVETEKQKPPQKGKQTTLRRLLK